MPEGDSQRQGLGPGPATLQYELHLDEGLGFEDGKAAIDNMMHDLERGNISFVLQLNVVPYDYPQAARVQRKLVKYAKEQGLRVAPWNAPIS